MSRRRTIAITAATVLGAVVILGVTVVGSPSQAIGPARYLTNDSHVHLTNYIQEGIDVRDMLRVMGSKVGRATLFGIPLQQPWSFRMDGNDAPTYYLESDAELYYYSFTDAVIAHQYLSLGKAEQARFDPMITGFNPADMYAADHVRRVLETFPGVFVGLGEFTLHKEFVTAKLAGEGPSLTDPALDRLFRFAGEVGLVLLVHCDVDTPFPKRGEPPAYLAPLTALFARHPHAPIIWAHVGLGRVVRPAGDQGALAAKILDDPKLRHVYFDISWTETAKYLVSSPEAIEVAVALISRHPDRFLFGTDEVAPRDQADYLRVLRQYQPLWDRLPPAVVDQVRLHNYTRLFDAARTRVRAWERAHVASP